MATSRSKLPSPGTGGGSITRGLLRAGMGLLKTTGKIYNALVGPEQEQTYGWTSQFFPRKTRDNKKSKVDSLSKNFGSIPKMSVDTDEILNLLKENYADEKRYREIQKSFAEERANEEERRHNQLVTALKKFTATGTTATVVAEKKDGGLLDMIRNMFAAFEEKVKGMIDAALSGIELFKKGSLLSSLLTFLKSPIFKLLSGPLLMVAGILGLAYALRKAVELVPDYSKLTPEEAKNILENASERDIESFGGREKLMQIVNGGREEALKKLEQPDLSAEDRAAAEKLAGMTVTPQTVTELPPAPPRPDETKGLAGRKNAERWDTMYGQTHNPDGTPKVRTAAKPLVPGSEESQAGAGRGSGQYEDFLARTDESQTGGQASFGVRPRGIKSVPVASPPSPVAQLTDVNRDLEMNFSTTSGESSGAPVIQQSNTQSAQNEPPIPSTATQRDDEAMSSKVFKDQRNRARAY
jgi:hypothetical protein